MHEVPNVLIIGAGGVGAATAHKAALNNGELGDVWLASRTPSRCAAVLDGIRRRSNMQSNFRLAHAEVDAKDVDAVARLIDRARARIVINVASPHVNLAVLDACLKTGARYIDTALYEKEGEIGMPPPWYANYEWRLKPRFEAAGVTAILGAGFDPGAVNAFCAWAGKHHLATIESIDILDVNAGSHGRYFATNFDAETNLREIAEDVIYFDDGEWRTVSCHTRSRTFDFPKLGEFTVYSMGHDEIHSLAVHTGARHVEFWMAFSDQYLKVFEVLHRLGLLGHEPVNVEGQAVVPLKLLKALLPDPASLAPDYRGEVCIGALVGGRDRDGRPRRLFVYSLCDHARCYEEVGAQAISYTTAVPAVTAALLIARGDWDVGRMVNVEELDPDPFMALMPELGIDWHVREEAA
ncbi:MAG TPA: saccharopine dehydrogenase family protein [Pseudomonadales bacterium]